MRPTILAGLVLLTGCATPLSSPEYVAAQSNWDVCRLTMGGPHSAAAEVEARKRGVDCAPMYPAIQARMQQQNAAVIQYLQTQQRPLIPPMTFQPAPLYQMPQQTHCQSYRLGNTIQTNCN